MGAWRDAMGRALPARARFEFARERLGDFLGRAFALFLIAPSPLCQIVIRLLQSALRGQQVDALEELWGQGQGDLIGIVLSFDLSGYFLPVENLVCGHPG